MKKSSSLKSEVRGPSTFKKVTELADINCAQKHTLEGSICVNSFCRAVTHNNNHVQHLKFDLDREVMFYEVVYHTVVLGRNTLQILFEALHGPLNNSTPFDSE